MDSIKILLMISAVGITYLIIRKKGLLLSLMEKIRPTPKPQVHEVHVIFENKLCTDGDDRLDRILQGVRLLIERQEDTVSQHSLNRLKRMVEQLRRMAED